MKLKHLVATLLLAGTSASFGATGFFDGLYFVTSLNADPMFSTK